MLIIDSRQKNGRHVSRPKEDLIFAPPAKRKKEKLPTLNILTRFLSDPLFAHCRPRSCGRQRANAPRKTKTHAKIFPLPAGASWTALCLSTVLCSVDSYAQIQTPQTPQFENNKPVTPNNNTNQQYRTETRNYSTGNNPGHNTNQPNFNNTPKKPFEEYNAIMIEEKRTTKEKYSSEFLNATKYYQQVFDLLSKMANGSTAYSFKQAVFNIENAYFDNKMKYEDFDKLVQEKVKLAKQFMKQEKLDTGSSLSKNYAIQMLFSKTYTQKQKDGTTKTIKPLRYDFKDYRGDTTWTNMFTTKLLMKGKGQCHSMPQAVKILANELGTKAKLVYAPEHLYTKFIDGNNQLYNFEATNGCNTTEQFVLQSGYISALAVKNKLYMDTLGTKRELSLLFFDLAQGLREKTGYSEMLLDYINKSIEFDPANILAISMKADYYTLLTMRGVKYYNIQNEQQIQQHPDLAELFEIRNYLYDMIDASGYQQMPKEAYEKWLKQLNSQKRKQESEEINKLILKQMKN